MTIVNAALRDELIIHHFLAHVGEEHLLIIKKCLERFRTRLSTASLRVSHRLELVSNSFLKDLKAILTELIVQFGQIRDWPDSGEDGVVPEGVAFWTEGRHHRDAFR